MARSSAFSAFLVVTTLVAGIVHADTFDSDGVEIYFTDQGTGDPLVLIHGYTMDGVSNFGLPGIIAGLASDYRVITIDARGHGASGKPQDASAYGNNMMLDVVNLLDHLGISQAHVAGYSMGGLITQKLVAEYPERILKAVVGGAGWNDQNDLSFGNLLAESLESGAGLGPLIIGLTPPGQPLPTPEAVAEINATLLATNDAQTLAAVARGFEELMAITENELRSNEVPLLYVVGALDPIMETVERAKGVVSNAEYVVLPGSDHLTAIADPMLLQAIARFLGED